MIGAPAIGGFVAFWAFWVLLVAGLVRRELGLRGILVFVALWVIGYSAFGLFFTSYVAALDIALVFTVFKGDVHNSRGAWRSSWSAPILFENSCRFRSARRAPWTSC